MTRKIRATDSGLYTLRYAYYGKEEKMLETIALVLIVLWILGFVTSYTMGGFIHILLVIAVVVLLIRIIQGRRL
ncbi:MAG: lmo0937 family membrane protein [Sulfuricurvum sp.]|uniref:lmo0937 family membrane protein n=1 Tax=Sulfuricurvum sp. TaxID=2025608 RepID=UPI0027253021|nr:lmo0937 family membrane protein [Sulfuricurvum sp.]MDO9055804.1 lmo0937 family membrane protein [Sulfuricurvum sp.]MDP2850529.1 lmo0937 family membrane protein [Sulfuricurvum sp.]MDP3291773.1 lmo0937 family membrane protein [Sulfuricurvum sp.]